MQRKINYFSYDDIMPLAKNCTEIYVWHTMTFTPPFRNLGLEDLNANPDTNLATLLLKNNLRYYYRHSCGNLINLLQLKGTNLKLRRGDDSRW